MAYYNATRQSVSQPVSSSPPPPPRPLRPPLPPRSRPKMNAICSRRCISEFAAAVASLALFSFYGFSLDSRRVRFLENVYRPYTLLFLLLFSNCKYALEFLWYIQVYPMQDFFLILYIPLAQSLHDTDLPQISQVV